MTLLPVQPGLTFELQYRRYGRDALNEQIKYINSEFMPGLMRVHSLYTADAMSDDVAEQLAQLTATFGHIADKMISRVNALQQKFAGAHTKKWTASVKKTLGIDINSLIDKDLDEHLRRFALGNAQLIKGVSSDVAKQISIKTLAAFRSNLTAKEFGKVLSQDFNEVLHGKHTGRTEASRKRAQQAKRVLLRRQQAKDPSKGTGRPFKYQSRYDLIARDQTSKLNSELTRVRHLEAGIKRYRWRTAGDERVRHAHSMLNNHSRRWNEPHPTEGHPGSQINCRCVAQGIIE